MASKASLLNLRFVLMANLREISILDQCRKLPVRQHRVVLGELSELGELVVIDVVAVILREQVGIDPIPPALGEDDGAVHVLVKALLEDAAAKIAGLSLHGLPNGLAQRPIHDAGPSRRFGKPGGFENAPRVPGFPSHPSNVAVCPMEIKGVDGLCAVENYARPKPLPRGPRKR